MLPLQTLSLHRPWHVRLWADSVQTLRAALVHAAAAWRDARQRRREQEEWRAAVELDPRVLHDIGAPDWLRNQADVQRDARRFERELMRMEPRRELRHFR